MPEKVREIPFLSFTDSKKILKIIEDKMVHKKGPNTWKDKNFSKFLNLQADNRQVLLFKAM